MSTFVVANNIVSEEKDHQSWAVGQTVFPVNVAITFTEPFTDDSYTFFADAPGVEVVELKNLRTAGGTVIQVSAATTEGYWRVTGTSNEFRSVSVIDKTTARINRGTKQLVYGNNDIAFPSDNVFADAEYQVSLEGYGVEVHLISKATDKMTVFASDACSCDYSAIGQ